MPRPSQPAVITAPPTIKGAQADKLDTKATAAKAAPIAPPKINFVYSGYIGGSAIDYYLVQNFASDGHVAIDASGAAYVSGMTKSVVCLSNRSRLCRARSAEGMAAKLFLVAKAITSVSPSAPSTLK